jgi:hypothetical protein
LKSIRSEAFVLQEIYRMASTMIFHTDGIDHLFGILNGSQSKTTSVYLLLRVLDGLSARPADAAVADTLSSNLSEVSTSGTGYARIAIAWTAATKTTVSGDVVLTFPAQVFSFTGTVADATHAAIATTSDNTGKLIVSVPLSAVRNFATGDTDTVTMKLQGGQHV